MPTDITVGMDPFDGVVRVNFDVVETGRRAQADMDADAAERAAAMFEEGRGRLEFKDNITGEEVKFPVEASAEIASWLRAAASALRAHKEGKVDMRLGPFGDVPKA